MDYELFKIKEYDTWDLFLHVNQFPYIGRTYAWAKREDADLITDINLEETAELFGKVIPAWYRAVKKLYNHDRPNLAILGNEVPHLHAHLIPRYNSLRNFHGHNFVDQNPKGNYAPYPKVGISKDVLLKIRDEIKNKL
jgi:diadenosine tetraphosphate (Ap4A) HIT family hydrolase